MAFSLLRVGNAVVLPSALADRAPGEDAGRPARGGHGARLGALITAYRASAAFQDLAPRTQSDYQRCFDYLQPIADTPLVRFDRSLIVRIRDDAYDGKTLKMHTRKTGQLVVWPVPATLQSILDQAPPSSAPTLAVNSRGHPWTEDGFRTSWRKLRLSLEAAGKVQPDLTIHGLRHTVATILREEGFDERIIAEPSAKRAKAWRGTTRETQTSLGKWRLWLKASTLPRTDGAQKLSNLASEEQKWPNKSQRSQVVIWCR